MSERYSLGRLAREPLYNTRAVVQTTGVPADTFRAWERRYELPRPHRTATNRRLYSDQDIGVINWLRARTDEGMTISQAIQRLKLEYPDVVVVDQLAEPHQAPREMDEEPQAARLRQRLLDAVIRFDAQAAESVIDEALARFSIEEFCARLVEPALQDIGARWSRNELSVAVEHFATRLFTRRLSAILTMVSPVNGRGTIVAACPAGEEHEVGLLVLAIVLSRRGWRVVYLGANVPVDDLVATALAIRPDLVCLSVTTNRAAAQAIAVSQALHSELRPPPPVAIGGHAFVADSVPRMKSDAHFIIGNASEAVDKIIELIDRH